MVQFLSAIPEVVLYGCVLLIVFAFAATITLIRQVRRIGSKVAILTSTIEATSTGTVSRQRNGLALATLDDLRSRCEGLGEIPRGWWESIDSHIEQYTSPEDVEGWFLTEKPRHILPYEPVIGRNFHSA